MTLLFASPAYADLAARLLVEAKGLEPGEVERRRFPDGESYQRLVSPVRGREVVLLAGTTSDEETVLAFDLACALVRQGAERLTWVCPYFGYQTMERAVRPGEVVVAKTRARLISSVPLAPLGNRLVLVDLHAAGIPHYFGDSLSAFHLYAKPLSFEAARAFGGGDFVLVAPDAGRASWVRSLAAELGVESGFVGKRRLSGERTEVVSIDARVEGRSVVLFDDMIRTGSTLLEAARALRSHGATRVHAVATHLVMPGDAAKRLLADGALDGIAGTDTHPRSRVVEQDGVVVRSVAGLLARFFDEPGDLARY